MAQGKELKVHIANLANLAWEETTGQDDLDINLGKTANTVKTKNDQQSFVEDEGVTVSFTMNYANPLATSQTQVFALHGSEAAVRVKVEEDVAGGLSWHGTARVVVGSITGPKSGVQSAAVTIAFDGAVTRTVSPAAF